MLFTFFLIPKSLVFGRYKRQSLLIISYAFNNSFYVCDLQMQSNSQMQSDSRSQMQRICELQSICERE